VPRRSRLVAAIVGFAALGAVGAGVAVAAFSGTTTNAANTFSAAADWIPPSGSSVIVRNGASVPGSVKAGGTYYVYSNVADGGGNPPSGLSTITADVSAVTAGQTALGFTTTGGPWTFSGTSYDRRSSSVQTAGAGLANGTSKSYTIATSDAAGNSTTLSGFSVGIDNVQPSASDVQAVPGGSANAIDTGDKLVFTYSEAVDPVSIKAGWDGSATTISVSIDSSNSGLVTFNVNLGSLTLGQKAYNGSGGTFNATMTMSGAAVSVTLGTQTAGGASRFMNANTMTWTPSASALDPAGNASTTTARNETGAADVDF
jgi:hypothetical protein